MNEENSSVWEHFGELRRILVSVILVIAAGFACSLFFSQNIVSFLKTPLEHRVHRQEIRKERITNSSSTTLAYAIGTETYHIPPYGHIDVEHPVDLDNLVILSPIEGMMTTFKVSFWVGLVGTSPIWIYLLLQFILPALTNTEKTAVMPFFLLSLLFLGIGFLFAFYLTIPLANQYLLAFNMGIGTNLWSLANYLDYSLFLMLANAFAFELTLILFFLVHYNILSVDRMIAMRRHMIVLAFILGAILTPPDVLTQFMLAIPLIGLYELTILYGRIKQRSKSKEIIF